MNDWIGLGIIVLIIFLIIYLVTRPQKPITQEEYEKRVSEGPGLLGASVMGVQKFLDPAAGKSMEVIQDLKAGHYDGQQESGDDDDKAKVKR
ncbi:MAG: hypothetical protein AUG51_04495 [Acidobacteria bacterium 13_1_20CM_3_53_8]|nr:MAG: hypothetical protein AUG51_04495 [Acidobacteria bacterium 13_1_20CM_3_53_8]